MPITCGPGCRVPPLGGARGGAKLLDVSLNGGMDLLGSVVETEMLEQHGGGQDGRGRIGLVLAGDVRSGTVDRSNMDGYSLDALMQPEAE